MAEWRATLPVKLASALRDRADGSASAPVRTSSALLLASAHAHGRGLWSPLYLHGDGERIARGLSRFREGAWLEADADSSLRIVSDGTAAWSALSAPIDDDGAAVRPFALIDGGRWSVAGASARIAGLSQRSANGGVRSLQVAGGASGLTELCDAGVPIIASWADFTIDDASGRFVGRVQLGAWRGRPLAVGTRVSGNAFSVIAHAQRSREQVWQGDVYGPAALLTDRVTVDGP